MQMRMVAMAGLILAGSQVVFGQTVSVGTSSSATSGTTTTVTIPVTVTTPAVTTTAAGSSSNAQAMAMLDVTSSWTQQLLNQSFTTVVLNNVAIDSANGWNGQTNTYTVPASGLYLLTSKLRLVDGTPAGISYGVGAGTSNGDSPSFLWSTTAGLRNSMMNTRLALLNKGDQVQAFSYVDTSAGAHVVSAELIVEQVK